ncbi:MAG TPA: glutamate formimidoyltransferase [Firmicutes bacterium]|nr:glutamate formimidoyltransferase [Bacillota bacterium]
MKIVECVPNFSEGRREEVVRAIVSAIAGVQGVEILDYSMDPDHNRSVVTFAGGPDAVREAAYRGIAKATELIDLNQHRGQHPRIGATDVVPFVPVEDVSMDECVQLARELGQRVAAELKIPVYLYEYAATCPERKNLANIRRGEFEALKGEISRPDRHPDFGEPRLHPTAGAIAIGARGFLVAFNVNLGTNDLSIAKRIARTVRGSTGGLVNVKALGMRLEAKGIVQVSMNLVDFRRTPIHVAFNLIKSEADRYGVPIVGSEIVGLVPQDALFEAAAHYLRLNDFTRQQVLEVRLRQASGAGGR